MTALLDRVAKAASTTAFGLSALAVAFFLFAAAIVVGVLFWQTNNLLTDQVLTTLNAEARILSSEMKVGGQAKLTETVSALSRPQGIGLYYLADTSGAKVAGNLNRIPPELEGESHGGVFTYQPVGDGQARSHLAVAIPVDLGSHLRLIIGRDVEDQRAFADSVRLTFLLGFGVLSIVGLLGGLAVSRLIVNRMDEITATSRQIMEGDLSRRIPTSGKGGELDALADSLNEMLDRIESLMSGLREVSDNIAHDLKTPLNRLRNSAEAALRDPHGGEAAYREGLERTIEKADELIKTFNALLLIARLEAGPLEESTETFDLGRFAADVSELYAPAAEEAGFALSIDTQQGLFVSGNRQLIGQAIANLIDNAIKYSRGGEPGSAITVRAYLFEGRPAISIGDHGPGIDTADREKVLKRFVRLEASRTKPGTGLGLSLVAAVARLHHGEVRLEDNQPGLRVVLLLSSRCLIAAPNGEGDTEPGLAAQ